MGWAEDPAPIASSSALGQPSTSLLIRNVRLPDGSTVDLTIDDGLIRRIGPGQPTSASRVIEGRGRLISPGFVEPHLHLDKALLMERLPDRVASVAEAIAVTAALKRGFSRRDILERAERTLRMALRHGTLAARIHAEVDPVLGLKSVEVALELRERWRGWIELQVCAFPQEGIQRLHGIEELLRESIRMGADVVGGVPYVDPDQRAHIDLVLSLACELDRPADFHLDFSDDPAIVQVDYLAKRTIALGLGGRVAAGHLTALGALPPERLKPLIELLAKAGLSVLTLPATDLHLGGRNDSYNVRRGLAPVKALLAGGVNVAVASNNVRNAFTPFGNADPLENGLLLMVGGHYSDRADLPAVWRMLTENAARAIGLAAYGLVEGRPANLVIFDAPDVWETLVGQAEKCYVLASGQVVAENRRQNWLAGPPIA